MAVMMMDFVLFFSAGITRWYSDGNRGCRRISTLRRRRQGPVTPIMYMLFYF
jgi:hypothetical protein